MKKKAEGRVSVKVADMHCDTIMKIFDSQLTGKYEGLAKNSFQLDKEKLLAGDCLLQNFAMFIDKEEAEDPYLHCKRMIGCFYLEMELNRDWIAPVKSCEDILLNRQAGKVSAMLTMEEGAPLKGEIEKLEEFYDLGVRMLTLTWNYQNEIGYPNALYFDEKIGRLDSDQLGLTAQGIGIVRRMNQLGMIIDVSHGSDQLVKDVLEHTSEPFVASHSNAREICGHPRNLPDELIRKMADRGGVIGMNYSDDFILNEGDRSSRIEGLVRHAEHFRNIGGIDCVGLGSDFDGIPFYEELGDASMVQKLEEALERARFSIVEIEKIFHGNVLRLYKDCLK